MSQGSRPTTDDRTKVVATLISQLQMILPPNQKNEAPQLAKKAEETVFNAAQNREDYLQRWEKKFHLLKNKATEMRGAGSTQGAGAPQVPPTQVQRQNQPPHMPGHQLNMPNQFNQPGFAPRTPYQPTPTNPILPRNPALGYTPASVPVSTQEIGRAHV